MYITADPDKKTITNYNYDLDFGTSLLPWSFTIIYTFFVILKFWT